MNEQANTQRHQLLYPLSCDQIAWLNDALDRYAYAISASNPSISRLAKGARLAAVIEIMEICGLCFADDIARNNAIAQFDELRDWVMKT